MKTFVKPGINIEFIAAADVETGVGVLLGANLFGYSINKTLSGEKGSLLTEGEVEVAKLAANVMAVGALVNFNDSTKEVQLATSTLDGVGIVTVAAGAATTTVRIKLTP